MTLVKQVQLKPTSLLVDMTIRLNNLFNYTQYIMRNKFAEDGRIYLMKDLYALLKTHDVYLRLKEYGSQVPQQVLKQVLETWTNWFKALKSYRKTPTKFNGRPRMPKYHTKSIHGGKNIVIFTKQQARHRDGYILLPNKVLKMGFPKIPFIVPHENVTFESVRIIPFHDRFIFEMIYEYECVPLQLDAEKKVGIDIGITNFIAMSNNFDAPSLLVKGGVVKATNQFFNKQLAKARSVAKKCNGTTKNARIRRLFRKRRNKLHDLFHQNSRRIINFCIQHRVSEIIVRYNKGWKQRVNLGKRTNQNFVSIPFDTFVKQLEYKTALVGIQVTRITEEYTSQRCSQCGVIRKQNRVCRGLYVCSTCQSVMNANLNAAMNILQKGTLESFTIGSRGGLTPPVAFKA